MIKINLIYSYKLAQYYVLMCLVFLTINHSTFICSEPTSNTINQQEAWVTIFVHGIMSIKPHVSLHNFIRFVSDNVEKTIYSKSIQLMRDDPFFYKNQAMQQMGLIKIDPEKVEVGYSSGALAMIFNEIEKLLPEQYQHKNYYYTFGWSGLLSAKSRYKDSQKLFVGLEAIDKQLRSKNIIPHFRIVGYSHGGNVGLNLALVRNKFRPSSKLLIDQLILLGTPIQSTTDYLINDPLFKRVYQFYSNKDRVQKLDFFSSKFLFSGNLFKESQFFKLPEKLIQVEFQIKRFTKHVKNYPSKIKAASDMTQPNILFGTSKLLRDVSPGHAELWFFGWTPMHYRKTFPLYPLSIVGLIPLILYEIDQLKKPTYAHKPIIFDIRPEPKVIILRTSDCRTIYHISHILSQGIIERLKEKVKPYQPPLYTNHLYNNHVHESVTRAYGFYKLERTDKRRKQLQNCPNSPINLDKE